MIRCISSSPVKDWRITTDDELKQIDVTEAVIGDKVYCVQSHKKYEFNGTKFVEQTN